VVNREDGGMSKSCHWFLYQHPIQYIM